MGNRARRIERFRASPGAIDDGMAPIEPKRVLEPIAGALIAAIRKPEIVAHMVNAAVRHVER
jgi:hypothetical protein